MQTILRKNICLEKESIEINRISINNLGALTLLIKIQDGEERLINFDEKETKKLKEFLLRWD